jgi:two-component system chemotaxis sensor kinase CheA
VSGGVSESNIRVDVGLLDRLMNLVGELVLARNRIQQFVGTQADTGFGQAAQRLNQITTELQEGVMKTRMQPIGTVWNKFPRVVRDLAVLCGKDVRVVMEGKDTELDKTVLEAIKDPLTHLVRNAIDHGLEPAADRCQAGKPEAGLLSLRAYHEGGQVIIEVSDDGRGMEPDRIRRKALDRGLVTPDQVARLSDREVLRLVFLPGFSTAERVTSVSGRGVGMDVVKTNIEQIGGAVDLQSRPGHGTTVKVKIPLTLAIIPALIIGTGGDSYAIPQVNLIELVRLAPGQARRQIELLYGAPVYRLRGNLLPLVYLDRVLGVEPPDPDEAVFVVVLQADDRPFGLVVAMVHDTEEIVVKPLGRHLKGIPLFAGATILGDGRVSLILDVVGLAQTAGVVSGTRGRQASAQDRPVTEGGARQKVLLFDAGEGTRMALPLDQVARLEEVPSTAIEYSAGREVVQYRGRIMPLVRLDRSAPTGGPAGADEGPLRVVVFAAGGRSVGLVVRRILDVADIPLDGHDPARATGVLGTAVILGRVTDLLDAAGVIRAAGLEPTPAGGGLA